MVSEPGLTQRATQLTATALPVVLQELPLGTDAVVGAGGAHTLVLTAVLHCVTHVHVCKYPGHMTSSF